MEKTFDGVIGIQTRSHRMVGADDTTELCRPLAHQFFSPTLAQVYLLWSYFFDSKYLIWVHYITLVALKILHY